MLVSYRHFLPQFQFSLSVVSLVYLSQWFEPPKTAVAAGRDRDHTKEPHHLSAFTMANLGLLLYGTWAYPYLPSLTYFYLHLSYGVKKFIASPPPPQIHQLPSRVLCLGEG
jgi:hypothetical protein